MTRIKMEDLSDDLENIFRWAPRSLRAGQISTLTPLGILFLLHFYQDFKQQTETLLGKSLYEQAQSEVQQRYAGSGPVTATPETAMLVDKAVELAGGPNQATIGHLLLSMFHGNTDAGQFLRQHGVTEQAIRQRMATSPTGSGQLVEQLTLPLEFPDTPLYQTVDLETLAVRTLSLLQMHHLNSVVVHGFPGVGRHTLLRYIADKIKKGHTNTRYSQWQIRQLNWPAVSQLQQPENQLAELAKQLGNTILVIDDMTQQRFLVCQRLLKAKIPVIAIANTSEVRKFQATLAGVSSIIEVKEPRTSDLMQIIQVHVDYLGQHHKLKTQTLDVQTLELLRRFGPAISNLALPGGAINLLDQAASFDNLAGNKELTTDDIAATISAIKGVPVGALTRTDAEKLQRLPEILGQRVIGQKPAKRAVTAALTRARAGLNDENRPLGVFVFLGPTGVGKTELVKALAEAMFDDEKAMVRIDMSEYMQEHSVSRLIGAPPGYVGYDEGGQLTNAVYQNPFQVVLFDEIDKAHPDVFNVLLPLMDDGRLTDGHGRTIDFRHTVVIMTSNHGSSMIQASLEAGQDFEQTRKQTVAWFKSQVRPEFFNRIDEVIVFEPISEQAAELILELQFARMVVSRFQQKYQINVILSAAGKQFLLEKGYTPDLGARPLRRAITFYVVDPLAEKILAADMQDVKEVVCDKIETEEGITFTERR